MTLIMALPYPFKMPPPRVVLQLRWCGAATLMMLYSMSPLRVVRWFRTAGTVSSILRMAGSSEGVQPAATCLLRPRNVHEMMAERKAKRDELSDAVESLDDILDG